MVLVAVSLLTLWVAGSVLAFALSLAAARLQDPIVPAPVRSPACSARHRRPAQAARRLTRR
jgi:hypothetical protein